MASSREDASDEDEWEETMVMVELSGIIDSDWIQKCGDKLRVVGLDTAQPFLQLDRYVFTGEYEDTPGTLLLFEETHQPEQDDGGNTGSMYYMQKEPPVNLKYKCHTHKKLRMQRVFLSEKEDAEATDADSRDESSCNVSSQSQPMDTSCVSEQLDQSTPLAAERETEGPSQTVMDTG